MRAPREIRCGECVSNARFSIRHVEVRNDLPVCGAQERRQETRRRALLNKNVDKTENLIRYRVFDILCAYFVSPGSPGLDCLFKPLENLL